ncbi:MAG: DNA polymerase I [Candidatus Competibacterales bacterium]
MTDTTPLVLVDGSAYLYRAFNALPPLTNRLGEPTGAIYGVTNMLHKLLADIDPSHMVVVFDAPGKNFRHELYADYKANRPPPPPELQNQVGPLLELVRALGLVVVQHPAVEADDVIATLTRLAVADGRRVLVSTSDKDLAQLVTPQVTLLDTMSDVTYDAAGVEAKFGVPPGLIVDYLTLVGDKSDNIPGVSGVGAKTAAKWLAEHGGLDALIKAAAGIKGKVGERLREHLPHLPLYRQLVTVKDDVALGLTWDDLARRPFDVEALRTLYTRLEFRRWLARLDKGAVTQAPSPAPTAPSADVEVRGARYQVITDWPTFERWLGRLRQAPIVAFDTETDSLNYLEARLVGVCFAVEPFEGAYVPLGHDYPGAPTQLERDWVLACLKPWLEDSEYPKVGQHLKYDAHVLANCGIALKGIADDTMLESYVVNSTATRHDMDSLARYYLDHQTITFEEIAGKGAKQLTFNQVGVQEAGAYAAEDADVTLRLHRHLRAQLAELPALEALYRTVEMPLVPVLQAMERVGVQIDSEQLRAQSQVMAERLAELEQRAHQEAGRAFNIGSPKQLQEILFGELGLPVRRKTPKGQPSTSEDVLQELADEHPLPALIVAHRELAKLKSTYTDRLPEMVNARTGRVHTSYHQAVTSTGRLSSSDPNLQNIPIRSDEGRRIRRAFVATPGYVLLAADYSQIELRIMAHLSQDEGLLGAFAKGEDIHRATALEVFAPEGGEVTGEQRRFAKTINFGLIYGMSPFGLARRLGIERHQAQTYVERYFARYPGVKDFMEDIRQQAKEKGYVETLFQRRIYLAEINASNAARRQGAERLAINAPMQGTAADIIKRAMIAVAHWLETAKLDARMVMQVHDELVFEVAEKDVEALKGPLQEHMVAAAGGRLAAPLEVEMGVGDNWEAAH